MDRHSFVSTYMQYDELTQILHKENMQRELQTDIADEKLNELTIEEEPRHDSVQQDAPMIRRSSRDRKMQAMYKTLFMTIEDQEAVMK